MARQERRQQPPKLGQRNLHQAKKGPQGDLENQPDQKLVPSFQEVFVARLVFRLLIVF